MISIGQRQSVRQEQRLSPQVIQYIKLLTKTTLELEQKIKEELENNPLPRQVLKMIGTPSIFSIPTMSSMATKLVQTMEMKKIERCQNRM